jgi:hypothetical protein
VVSLCGVEDTFKVPALYEVAPMSLMKPHPELGAQDIMTLWLLLNVPSTLNMCESFQMLKNI